MVSKFIKYKFTFGILKALKSLVCYIDFQLIGQAFFSSAED